MFKMAAVLVSMAMSLSAEAGYDIKFIHDHHTAGYLLVVIDDNNKEVIEYVSPQEFMAAMNDEKVQDALVKRVVKKIRPLPY